MGPEKIIRKYIRGILSEEFKLSGKELTLSEPYDTIKTIKIGNRVVYVIFGDIDYYKNKQAILAIKRKSNELILDGRSYADFLKEFRKRFYSVSNLSDSDLIVSVETTCPVTTEMAGILQIPFIKNGFKKIDPSFKMIDINDFGQRMSISNLFNLDFEFNENDTICILDDFTTSGSTFKNAFEKLPNSVKAFGVCLFKLNS